jgi:hypothetical protein
VELVCSVVYGHRLKLDTNKNGIDLNGYKFSVVHFCLTSEKHLTQVPSQPSTALPVMQFIKLASALALLVAVVAASPLEERICQICCDGNTTPGACCNPAC